MRRLSRPDLDQIDSTALPVLKERQNNLSAELAQHPKDSKEWNNTITTHWDRARDAHPLNSPEYEADGSLKKGRKPRSVKEAFQKMNRGSSYCMYCEYSPANTIDHFWPKMRYPEKAFNWNNLFWTCSNCNSAKGESFDLDKEEKPKLLNPAEADPRLHITLSLTSGNFAKVSDHGEYTITTIQLNLRALPEQRRNALDSFRSRLNSYCAYREKSDQSTATTDLKVLMRDPFQFIFEELIHLYREDDIALPKWCKTAFDLYSELYLWFSHSPAVAPLSP